MSEILPHEVPEFCFHEKIRHIGVIRHAHRHRSCWGPHTAEMKCQDCGATVEVKR